MPQGHSFSSTWTLDKAPTCAEQGSQSRHCTKCDKKTDVIYVSPTGNHTYTAWKTTKIPTVLNPVSNGAAARSAARCLQESLIRWVINTLIPWSMRPMTQRATPCINARFAALPTSPTTPTFSFSLCQEPQSNPSKPKIHNARVVNVNRWQRL